jgi:hypothetical protein
MAELRLDPNAELKAPARATVIAAILDKSGSMAPLQYEVISGFNKFLAEQQAVPGEARIHVTLFDTSVVHHDRGSDVRAAKPLDGTSYQPGGMTALLDAVGATLSALRSDYGKGDDVMVLIVTDGQENSSHRFKRDDVSGMIDAARSDGWEFMFMGADETAWSEAANMGISASSVSTYTHDAEGVHAAYAQMSACVSEKREGKKTR